MSIYVIGVFAMFILYLVVGNLAGRKVKNVDDYYVAGRNAPTILVVGSLIASYLSTVAFMGEVGFSYSGYLLPFMFMYVTCATGYFVGAKFFGRYIRRAKALTIPQFFGDRFKSKRIQMLSGIVTVIGIGCYLVAVTQGTALLLEEITGTSYFVSLLIVWAVFTSFSLYAGSKGILITETLMFIVFTVMALISVPFILRETGGWPDAIKDAVLISEKPGLFDWHGVVEGEFATMGTSLDVAMWIIVLGAIWISVISISPWQASRYLMARDEHVVFRSGMISPIMAVIVCTLLHFSVTTINNVDINIVPVERVYIWASMEYFPVVIGIIVCGGILSAGLSSCATFITLIGFSLSNDVYALIRKKESYQQSLTGSRIAMAIVGLIVLVVTYYQPPAVMWISYFAATLFGTSWAVVGFMSIWSKRITEKGAFWGMFSGLAAFIILKILNEFAGVVYPTVLRPEIIAVACSAITVLIVNAISVVTPEEKKFREQLHVPPQELYQSEKEIKQTMRYPKILIVSGIIFSILLYVFYYMPYQDAIALL